MYTTTINEIVAFIFGRKYYANIVGTRGTDRCELCAYIFHTRQEANKHRQQLMSTMSFSYIETISFRSHKRY